MDNQEIIKQLEAIADRNRRVEINKAWEVSVTRRLSIIILTYLIAAAVMYALKVERFYLNALIPVIGYLLSTLSLPVIKRYWIKQNYNQHEKI